MDLDAWSACLKVLRRRHPRAPAGPARARGTDRGRAVRDHPAGAAARVHPPGQAQGRRPGARPPRRRVRLLPLQRRPPRPGANAPLWQALRAGTDDPLLRQDAERVPAVLAMRAADQNWADIGGRRHGAPLFARPHLGSAGARRAAAARARRRARRRLRRRRAGRTARAACAPLRLHRHQPRAWSPPRASACAATDTSRCARATCRPCPSTGRAASTWCC